MNWNDLSMSAKSDLMKLYLKHGITSLDYMREHYNKFAEGGHLFDDGVETQDTPISDRQQLIDAGKWHVDNAKSKNLTNSVILQAYNEALNNGATEEDAYYAAFLEAEKQGWTRYSSENQNVTEEPVSYSDAYKNTTIKPDLPQDKQRGWLGRAIDWTNKNPWALGVKSAIQFIDPTGITSWPDIGLAAYDLYNGQGSWGNLSLEVLGGIPMMGKVLSSASKVNHIQRALDTPAEAVGHFLANNKITKPIGQKLNDLTEAVQQLTAKPAENVLRNNRISLASPVRTNYNTATSVVNFSSDAPDIVSDIVELNQQKQAEKQVKEEQVKNTKTVKTYSGKYNNTNGEYIDTEGNLYFNPKHKRAAHYEIDLDSKPLKMEIKGKIHYYYRAKHKYAQGGPIKTDPYQYFLSTIPENLRDYDSKTGLYYDKPDYNMRRYWELNGYPKDFDDAMNRKEPLFVKENGGYHARSVSRNRITGNFEFMKSSNHPTHHMELDWYYGNNPEAIRFRNDYEYVPGVGTIPDQYIRRYDEGGPISKKAKKSYEKSAKKMRYLQYLFGDISKEEAEYEDPQDTQEGYYEANNGTPQATYLMPRELQEEIFKAAGYTKADDKNYGLVAKAVGDKDVPIYQLNNDVVDRSTLNVVGNDYLTTGDTEEYHYLFDNSRLMTDPGSYPVAYYVDPVTGKPYFQGWDYNDYTGTADRYKFLGNMPRWVYKLGEKMIDSKGSPVVVRTGIIPMTGISESFAEAMKDKHKLEYNFEHEYDESLPMWTLPEVEIVGDKVKK